MKNIFINIILLVGAGIIAIFSYSIAERYFWNKKRVKRVEKKELRVEVLNGAGVPKLAQKVTAELRERGFDVVYFGNSTVPLSFTCILDRRFPDLRIGKILGKEIGCSRIYFESDPDDLIDVTIILGKDYKKYFPKIEEEWE